MKRFSAFVVLAAALSVGYFTAVAYESALVGAVVTAGICAAGLSYVTGRPLHILGVDPAGTFNDGGVAFGSQLLSIGGTGFVAENINVTRGSRELDQNDQIGRPNKQVLIRTKRKGTLTLQLPDATTAAPAQFTTVAITPIGAGTAENFIIMEVGDTFTFEGIQKVNCSIVEKLN